MRKSLLCVLIVLSMTVAAWAEDGVTDSEILIGMVNAQKGPASGLGTGMLAGADSVFQDVNSRGGIGSRKIRLIVADDGYEPDKTIDETINMIENNKVFALFGYVGTPTANAIIPIIRETQVPLIGLFTGAMTLRAPVIPTVVNVRASYDDETEALVKHFINKGAKSFGVFYQDDGFGQAVLSGTEKALGRRGMSVVAKGTFQRNTTAVQSGLARMISSKPDVVIMVGPYAPLSMFIQNARAEGLASALATVSFVGTSNLVEKVGRTGDGVVISQVVPSLDDDGLPVTRECRGLINKYHPAETFGYVNFEGCVTAKIMVSALEAAGAAPTRQGLITALEAMKGRDFGGIEVTLGPDDHQAVDRVYLTEIRDGKIATVK